MRLFLTRRWVLFALAVGVLALLAWRLGVWQFDRAEERTASNRVVERNLAAAPVPVGDVLAVDTAVEPDDEWRRVSATGVYDSSATVTIRYQTRDGRSGVDVVTPLVTDEGPALVVDRGWLATENSGTAPIDVPSPPAGEVTVVGWVRADADPDDARVTGGSARAVSSRSIAALVDAPVLGGFIDLESEDPAPDTALEPAETPDLGGGPHFFYGLQWWFFAALAIGGFLYLAWDERRQRRTAGPGSADPLTTPGASRRRSGA